MAWLGSHFVSKLADRGVLPGSFMAGNCTIDDIEVAKLVAAVWWSLFMLRPFVNNR